MVVLIVSYQLAGTKQMTHLDIQFHYEENIGEENRGWVVDKLSAFIDGEEVGYLKIEYIPAAKWEKWYKSPLDYMVHIHGWSVGQFGTPDVMGTMTVKKLKSMAWYFWHKEFPNIEPGPEMDHLVKKLERGVERKYAKKLEEFKEYHFDAPKPAWIEVKPEFRRRGIGTALYLEASRQMRARGLTLRASTLQSGSAEGVWRSLLERGLAEHRGKFVYII